MIHVKKVQLLSYFSKTLHFEAQKFDKRVRQISNNYPLEKLSESSNLAQQFDISVSWKSNELEELFEDQKLHNIVAKLSPKQKEILYLLYVMNMNESMVAQKLNISQQAVNKMKINTLAKIKRNYK